MSDEPPAAGTIAVIEERLEVRKRVQRSGRKIRVVKRVAESPVAIDEELMAESLHTERVPVGRVIEEATGIRQEGDVTIIPVIEERLVIRKELVLVEEWRITRRKEMRRFQKQEVVRRSSVTVERVESPEADADARLHPASSQRGST